MQATAQAILLLSLQLVSPVADSTHTLNSLLHLMVSPKHSCVQHREALARKEAENGGKPFEPVMLRIGGRFGCGGKVKNAREHFEHEIKLCEGEIDTQREKVYNEDVAQSFFVIFNSQVRDG